MEKEFSKRLVIDSSFGVPDEWKRRQVGKQLHCLHSPMLLLPVLVIPLGQGRHWVPPRIRRGEAWKRDVLAISLWPHPHLWPPLSLLPLPTPGISKLKMHREIRNKNQAIFMTGGPTSWRT